LAENRGVSGTIRYRQCSVSHTPSTNGRILAIKYLWDVDQTRRTVCGRYYRRGSIGAKRNNGKDTAVSGVLALLGRIAAAPSVEVIWELATSHLCPLGFSRLNYGFTKFRYDRSIGDPDDVLFLTTTNAEYAQRYFRGGLYARTPVYRWVTNNVGYTTWRWVQEAYEAGTLPPDEMDAVRQNKTLGVVAGMSISFPETSSRSKGALGMIADVGLSHDDVDAIWAAHNEEIMAVANMMHLKISQLPMPTRRRPLTLRQREALEWVADGKTAQDIAILMGVSPAMIEKHLRLARDALDVETTAQAVAKGAMLNMIFQPANRDAPLAALEQM
jgi:DNA-binding CsgD family transcriptional regulator